MRRVILIGLVACCLAAGGIGCDEAWYDTPGLYNRRNHPLEATVRLAHACGPDVDLRDPDNYAPAVRRRLYARDLVALGTLKSVHSSYGGLGSGACTAVWLELPGLYEAVLKWDGAWSGWDPEEDPYDYSLVVEGTRDDVVVHVPAGMQELPPPEL